MNEFLRILITFCAFVGIHILILRVVGSPKFIRNSVVLLILFLASPLLLFGGKLVFLSLWNMYMFALICSRNSVSLRILDELMRAPEEALTKNHLLELFSDQESLSARIELMKKNAFLHSIGPNEVELSRKGRLLARAILAARGLFGELSQV